jgi:hypothetical protein
MLGVITNYTSFQLLNKTVYIYIYIYKTIVKLYENISNYYISVSLNNLFGSKNILKGWELVF